MDNWDAEHFKRMENLANCMPKHSGKLNLTQTLYSIYRYSPGSVVPLSSIAFVVGPDPSRTLPRKLAGRLTQNNFENAWECIYHLLHEYLKIWRLLIDI